MWLHNLYFVNDDKAKNFHIRDGKINAITAEDKITKSPGENELFFNDALAFPGLINSHDHLDFNLFPPLANKIYNSYAEWGPDIQKKNKDKINAVLKIPLHLCVHWGTYKNLLNGVTTVVNHGAHLSANNKIITVFQQCHSLHSIQFEKYWRFKINRPFKNNYPFVIHAGEGKDEASHKEIDQLLQWNLFKRNIIGIHGVAMTEKQAGGFKALVWCPASNYFLLNKTAAIDQLKNKTKIIFGTDSTLTAFWNLWEHLRLARNTKMAGDEELFNMLTTAPADVWNFPTCGKLIENYDADIVIAKRKKELKNMDAFYAINPEDILLILHRGNIRLADDELHHQLKNTGFNFNDFSKIYINDRPKYVQGNLPAIMNAIKKYYPEINFPVDV